MNLDEKFHDLTSLQAPDLVAWAEGRARVLYDGKLTPHRSCGIALAETFARRTEPYQALRRGGITGEGECGAIKAGELILGEMFGDPSPTGTVTPRLRRAIVRYRELWTERVDRGKSATIVCNELTGQFAEFSGADRHSFCTKLASTVAACVAQAIVDSAE